MARPHFIEPPTTSGSLLGEMAQKQPNEAVNAADDGDLAKALQELAKGERTATALENHLTAVEAKIEALLAQAEKDQASVQEAQDQRKASGQPNGESSKQRP